MKRYAFVLVITLAALTASGSGMAESTLFCPDLSQAKQLLECTGEAEIQRMFKHTCDFERDPNSRNPDMCDSYAEFKRRKYTALWESGNGEFMGYLTCLKSPEEIKQLKPVNAMVSQKNGLFKLICNYAKGVSLTMRTHQDCRLPTTTSLLLDSRAQCDGDANHCKFSCK